MMLSCPRQTQILSLLALVFAFATSNTANAQETSLVFLAKQVPNGVTAPTVLVPHPADISGDSLRDRARSIFNAIRGMAPTRYEEVDLLIPDGFDLARRVQVQCVPSAEVDCSVVLGEVGTSLAMAGVEKITLIPANQEWSLKEMSTGLMLPVFPFWAALPPEKVRFGLINLGRRYVNAAEFYSLLKSKSPELAHAARTTLRSGPASALVAVARSAKKLGLTDLRPLMKLLDNDDPQVRMVGLEQLRKDRSTPFLKRCERLVNNDPDPAVKLKAVRVLVGAGKKEYKVYLLLEDLDDPNETKVLKALESLLKTGDKRIAPNLVPLLSHVSPEVRTRAVTGLEELRANRVIASVFDRSDIDIKLKTRLGKHLVNKESGSNQSLGLGFLLNKGEPEDVLFAMNAIGGKIIRGQDAAIIKVLEGKGNAELKKSAIEAAAKLRVEEAVPTLAKISAGNNDQSKSAGKAMERIFAAVGLKRIEVYASNKDAAVRAAALRSLGRLGSAGGARSQQILLGRLSDKNPIIKRAAVEALAKIANSRIVSKLAPMSKDEDPIIRAMVVNAAVLAQHGTAKKLVVEALKDRDDQVKLAGVIGIEKLAVKDALPELWKRIKYAKKTEMKRAVLSAIISLTPNSSEREPHLATLQEMFYDMDVEIKSMAVDAVYGFRDPAIYAALGGLVGSENKKLQLKAIKALGATKDANAVEYVYSGLMGEDADVKDACLNAIRDINSMRAEKAMQEYILNETHKELRAKAIRIVDDLSGD